MAAVLFLFGLVSAGVLICLIWDYLNPHSFHKRFPPISDDQFMALCPPGTNREIALKVRQVMSDCSGIDYEQIYPDSQLVRDLDFC